ncbi:MAG TPA: DUF922 domain-containing Zn-dependent protease [Trichocoleus sp.]
MLNSKLFVLCLLALVTGYSSSIGYKGEPDPFKTQLVGLHQENSTLVAMAASAPSSIAQIKQAKSSNAPTVSTHYRYYPITGNSVAELRAQMTQQGPMDLIEGRRYDARTDWSVQWAYTHARTQGGCAIGSLTTSVDVTITYPQWTPTSRAPRSAIAEWQRYMTALQLHENGHKDNGIAAGQAVVRTLSQLPAYSSCQRLDAAASSAAQSAIRHYNQQDLNYDQTTYHGYSQGAVFGSANH